MATTIVNLEPPALSQSVYNALTDMGKPRTLSVPAFVGGAATIAPGTSEIGEYTIAAETSLTQNATLTVSSANMESGHVFAVTCRALSLGHTIDVVWNSATLATIPATLSAPRSYRFYYDGVAVLFDHFVPVV